MVSSRCGITKTLFPATAHEAIRLRLQIFRPFTPAVIYKKVEKTIVNFFLTVL
jgi:hypothetical protein